MPLKCRYKSSCTKYAAKLSLLLGGLRCDGDCVLLCHHTKNICFAESFGGRQNVNILEQCLNHYHAYLLRREVRQCWKIIKKTFQIRLEIVLQMSSNVFKKWVLYLYRHCFCARYRLFIGVNVFYKRILMLLLCFSLHYPKTFGLKFCKE